MASSRTALLTLLSAAILGGTLYSVINQTYIDTSDPLQSDLPHPLQHQSIFAQKSNLFNVLFVKKAWGWTSAAFFLLWLSSPPQMRRPDAFLKWATTTLVWGTFAAWFFGPGVLQRLLVASGGECVLQLPSDVVGDASTLVTVPAEFCYTKTTISPSTHPSLFTDTFITSHRAWTGRPRLYKGHDVSGHIFLLTLSVLFLHDQLLPAWRAVKSNTQTNPVYKLAAATGTALLGLWIFMTFTTSIYWHTPFEKITGFALGLAGFVLTQLPFRASFNRLPRPSARRED